MRTGTVIVLAGAFLLAGSAAGLAEQHKEKAATGSEVSCAAIEAAWDEGGGNVSEDMLAKKLNVSVERIRTCLKKEEMAEEKAETPPK